MKMNWRMGVLAGLIWQAGVLGLQAQREVYIKGLPDYQWYAGCFGTACGNLFGFWDRNGLPDFYTGPTGGGVAPLDDKGANIGIRSMWASKAGLDGRPANKPGHIDDYWAYYWNDWNYSYEDTRPDPYVLRGRPEHEPDCIGDFIGLSQLKWTNMNGECDGNIDAYSFVYWDKTGGRRTNFVPGLEAGSPPRDIQSGLREWSWYCGYDADVYTQLTDFNPTVPAGRGFTFEDLKREIDAGYPVLLFLQHFDEYSRNLPPIARANPDIHGMLAYGYSDDPSYGIQWVYYRTSWASSPGMDFDEFWHSQWDAGIWQAKLPLRGVICYHPKPRIRSVTRVGDQVTLSWDGPSAVVHDLLAGTDTKVHRYQIERTASLTNPSWTPIGSPTTDLHATVTDCCDAAVFYRVRLLGPNE